MRLFALFAAFVACVSASPPAAPRRARPAALKQEKVTATNVRFWSLADVTRIAIQTTAGFEFEANRLSNPPRTYYDLLDCRLDVPDQKRGMSVVPVNDALVKQIRLAQYKLSVTRVVLDLKGEYTVTASQLENPNRLIIEVRGAPAQAGESSVSKTAPAQETPPTKSAPPPPAAAPIEQKAPAAVAANIPKMSEETAREEAAAAPDAPPSEEPVRLAQPAKRNSNGERSLTRALGLKLGKVVIDPGHGGHDTGTIGPSGLKEKDIALDIAKRLAELVETRMGSQVALTRSEDVSVPLEARTQRANAEKADLFLSIHVNSSRYPAVSGAETFYLNFTRSRADMEVAARENAGSSKSIHELSELVQKIALDDKIEESRDFAANIQEGVHQLVRKQNPRARDRGVKKAPFVVLIGAQMPSVLVEVGFLTNAAEERLMGRPEHRQKIAEALYEGLTKYAGTLSHFQVAKTGNLD